MYLSLTCARTTIMASMGENDECLHRMMWLAGRLRKFCHHQST